MATQPCTRCGHPQPVQLQMQVKSGEVVTLTSCSRCEERVWLCNGARMSRDEVLKLTAGDPEFALREGASRDKPARARVRRGAAGGPAGG